MMSSGAPTIGPGSILRQKWRLDALLSKKGDVEVYSATHRNSRRFIAKILSAEASRDTARVERFLARAYVANQIAHAAMVHALDDDRTPDGRVFIVRDLVDGETFADLIAREGRTVRPTHAVELVLRALEGLEAAHALGTVHARLALDHLLLDRHEHVRLIGFRGPPETMNDGANDPALGLLASPEHASSDPSAILRASDVFSIGALGLLLLTGKTPALDGTRTSVHALLPALADPIAEVFDRALFLPVTARWESAKEMRAALEEAREAAVRVKTGPMRGTPVADSTSMPMSTATPSQRGPRKMCVAVAVPTGHRGADAASETRRLEAFLALLRTRLGPQGLRIDFVPGLGALIVPPAANLAREEACVIARAALTLSEGGVPAKTALLLVPDLLTANAKGDERIVEAFDAALRREHPNPVVEPAVAFLLEGRFALGREQGSTTLVSENVRGNVPRLLGIATACVGRDREISAIASALESARASGRVHASLIVGAPGVGKSRVLHEGIETLREREPGAEVWFAKADKESRETTLGILRDLVRQACSVGPSDDAETEWRAIVERVRKERLDGTDATRIASDLALLAGALGQDTTDSPAHLDHDAAGLGDRAVCALQDLMAAVARERPLAVILEDVQWADPASLDALGRTLEHLAGLPWTLIATTRPEIDRMAPRLWVSSGVVRTDLAALEERDLENIARISLGPGGADEVAALVKAAGGNPLHLEERIRARAEGRPAAATASLEAVVQGRLASLSDTGRRTLAYASVFGSHFWFRGLGHMLARTIEGWRIAECLDDLARRELILPSASSRFANEAEFVFRHDVIEAEAYALLPRADRDAAHRRAGEWLERAGERDPAILAAHFAHTDQKAEAAAWHERSAAEALARNDTDTAISLAERGLAYGPRGEVALSLHTVLAESFGWRADHNRASTHAKIVFDSAKIGSTLWCQALAVFASSLGKRGESEAFLALAREALNVPLPVAHERAYASAIATFMSFALRMGRNDLVAALNQRVAVLERSPDPAVVAHALNARSWCAMFAGDFSACLGFDREVVKKFDEAGDLRSRCRETTSIGYDFMTLGEYALAETAFQASIAMGQRLGVTRAVLMAKAHLCPVLLAVGRVTESLQLGREALEIAERGGDTFASANVRTYIAASLAATGDTKGAIRELTLAIDSIANLPGSQVMPRTELARVHLLTGDVGEALAQATIAMNTIATMGPAEEGDAGARLVYAEALRAAGRLDEAAVAIAGAVRRIAERASRISDRALQRTFLERVPDHARTIQLARTWGVPQPAT